MCVYRQNILIYERVSMKYSGGVGRGYSKNQLDFGGDLDSDHLQDSSQLRDRATGAAIWRTCTN